MSDEKSNSVNQRQMSFVLGQVYATPGALAALQKSGQSYIGFLARHLRGDWGEVCKEDWSANDQAVKEGTRLLSAYRTSKDERIWIITETDRSTTTLLLPDEY